MTDESAAGEVILPAWSTDYKVEGGTVKGHNVRCAGTAAAEQNSIEDRALKRRSAIHARRVRKVADAFEVSEEVAAAEAGVPDPTTTKTDRAWAALRLKSTEAHNERMRELDRCLEGLTGRSIVPDATTSGHEYVGLTERTPWGGNGPDPRPTAADRAAAARAESCGRVTDEDGPEVDAPRWGETPTPFVLGYGRNHVLRPSEANSRIQGNCKFADTLRDAPAVPSSVLTEAERAVTGPRQHDYDHPVRNFALIAQDWRNWIYAAHGIDVPIDGRDVAFMNAGQKRCREAHNLKHDNRVDTCGYMRALQLGEESALRQLHGEDVPESERLWKGMLQSTWSYLLE